MFMDAMATRQAKQAMHATYPKYAVDAIVKYSDVERFYDAKQSFNVKDISKPMLLCLPDAGAKRRNQNVSS